MKRTTGHLEEKNGKWYAAINLYAEDGKRKVKWIGLDLECKKGTKTEATHRLNQLLEKYNSGELYLQDSMTHAERERRRLADSPVEDYLAEWLEEYRPSVSKSTYEGYESYLRLRIIPFFQNLHLKVREVTGDEINAFYQAMHREGLKGTTAQRYHALLHRAFKMAVKRRIIPANPVEQADRPRSEPFIAGYYNSEEIKELLRVSANDELHLVIALTAYYGLRRSEVLGLKWSAVDFAEKKIHIWHKVLDEKDGPHGYDVMKTKSSQRSLALIPVVEKMLLAERERQAEMKRAFGKGYCRDYEDYVCVDALGKLYRPNYVSDHFAVILKQNGLRHIRFHDLRHSCASLLLSLGRPMKEIQDWLGHSDMNTTANIYSHLDSHSKIACATAIGEALE